MFESTPSNGYGGYVLVLAVTNFKISSEAHIRPVPVLNCVSDIPSAAYATVSASPAGLTVLGGLQEGSRGRSGKRPHTASGRPS